MWTLTFEQLAKVALFDSRNQVVSIFSSKVIKLPNNGKNYVKIQRPLVFRYHWYGYLTFRLSRNVSSVAFTFDALLKHYSVLLKNVSCTRYETLLLVAEKFT